MSSGVEFYLLTIVIALNFILSVIILMRSARNKINLLFGLLTMGLVVWGLAILGFHFIDIPNKRIWIVVTHSSAAFLAMIFLFFSLSYPSSILPLKNNKLVWTSLIVFFLLIVLSLFFTSTIIGKVTNSTYQIYQGYFVYVGYMLVYFSFGYIFLIQQYKRTHDDNLKKQIIYVIVGTVISSLLALITDLILPWTGTFQFTWLGPIFTFLMIIPIAYAILRYNLFNIKLISTELLVFALWLLFLLRIRIADKEERIIDILVLLSLILIGIFLIRSVAKEIRQRERLEDLTKRLGTVNSKLQELDKARAEFISIASHQLRTPPATIKWYLAAIRSGDFGKINPKAMEGIKKAEMTNNSQISLIDDLLNVSRIERGKMEFLFEDVDVAKVVDEVVNELIPQAATNKIKIIYHKYQGKLPMIVADPEKIQQAINNVIDNAIKYTKKGSVTVRVAKKRGSIEISVTDTGKGMEQEDLEKIFEKYGRGKDAASHAAGLGLGLYVCRVILDHHHGTIKALSEGEGKGSTFIISLPIHTDLRKEKIFDLAKEMAAK